MNETPLDRLKNERSDLFNKMNSLNIFLNTYGYACMLDEESKYLLKIQHSAMEVYLNILDRRIKVFIPNEATK